MPKSIKESKLIETIEGTIDGRTMEMILTTICKNISDE
jgi:hypothetical protein